MQLTKKYAEDLAGADEWLHMSNVRVEVLLPVRAQAHWGLATTAVSTGPYIAQKTTKGATTWPGLVLEVNQHLHAERARDRRV